MSNLQTTVQLKYSIIKIQCIIYTLWWGRGVPAVRQWSWVLWDDYVKVNIQSRKICKLLAAVSLFFIASLNLSTALQSRGSTCAAPVREHAQSLLQLLGLVVQLLLRIRLTGAGVCKREHRSTRCSHQTDEWRHGKFSESCRSHCDTGSNVTQLSVLHCGDTGAAVKTHPATPEKRDGTL